MSCFIFSLQKTVLLNKRVKLVSLKKTVKILKKKKRRFHFKQKNVEEPVGENFVDVDISF